MMLMNYVLTFLEGIITFVSPCMLPLLPVYLAYFAGGAQASGDDETRGSSLRTTLVCAIGFVVGFALVFTLMGAGAGAVGTFLVCQRTVFNVLCGLVLVTLGLNYLGILNIGLLNRTLRANAKAGSQGFFGSLLFGVVFAIGWSPCVGTFLASALSLAASSANAITGVLLLLCFSAGLGLPFVISALLVNQLEGAFVWIKRHYNIINKVSGALLVIMGVLMACGVFGS